MPLWELGWKTNNAKNFCVNIYKMSSLLDAVYDCSCLYLDIPYIIVFHSSVLINNAELDQTNCLVLEVCTLLMFL